MFKAAAKLRLNSRLDDLARHSPVRERDPEDLPSFNFPRGYAAEPVLFSIVSPLEPNFVHMPLHKDGKPPYQHFQHIPSAINTAVEQRVHIIVDCGVLRAPSARGAKFCLYMGLSDIKSSSSTKRHADAQQLRHARSTDTISVPATEL